MKRVIFVKAAPLFPIQGADISMFERMSLLSAHGWDGILVATAQAADQKSFERILTNLGISFDYDPSLSMLRYRHLEIECRIYLGPNADYFVTEDLSAVSPLFDKAIGDLEPDFFFCNLRDPFSVDYVTERSLPHLAFLTEDGYPRKDQPGGEKFASRVARISRIAVTTKYMAQSLRASYSHEPELYANAIAPKRHSFVKEGPGEFITLVHPYAYKGVEIFFDIARALPERKFLVYAGTGAEYRTRKARLLSLPNLTLAPFTNRSREIYQKSRILLVPSICQDTCPRVVMEALYSGTPVIGSGRGGMRDLGGAGAIYEPLVADAQTPGGFKIEGWIRRLQELDDPERYEEACSRARARAEEFAAELEASMKKLAASM